MNCETVELRGDEQEVSPSCEQQELWSLGSDVLEGERKRTNFSTVVLEKEMFSCFLRGLTERT